ncbi:uncharacterized protein LOC107364676 [Tetranychus urticae]|uniref:Uncharacterized protein n=1 Tax=Tetranychus urticae TaxID=32264 RepID=T1KK11_TETUR|nr:uncharacterized protein LOC107364676 [Tetranychus urticae]
MNKSTGISYSSINRAGVVRRTYCNPCCGCHPWLKLKSCLKSCARLPWTIIFAILMSSNGIGLICYSLVRSTVLSDQLTYDLFNRKYIWLNDLEVGIIILGFVISLLILINLIIGCTTNTQKRPRYNFTTSCYDNLCTPASNCVVKTLFIINYILLVITIAATLTLGIFLFAAYTTSSLCANTFSDGNINTDADITPNSNQTRDSLNLLIFQPFIGLPQNETQLLILTGSRLTKFCDELIPSVLVYVQMCFAGLILLVTGLLNFILTVNTNWTVITTKRKFEEVVFLNSAEMTNFDEME